jgi:hypothetical protein
MADKKDVPSRSSRGTEVTPASLVDSFLGEAQKLSAAAAVRPRLTFALDATMSRQPTWDLACRLQGEMFDATGSVGGLSVQLVYFRGFSECRASRWVINPGALKDLMTGIDCRGGHTQIVRVLRHVRAEAQRDPVKVLVYVGDAMEERIDDVCAAAGELGLLGVKAFMFHEGHDPVAARAFKEVARLTGGAYARFDASAPESLKGLLRAAAAYAGGGMDALTRLASDDREARLLLTSMGTRR